MERRQPADPLAQRIRPVVHAAASPEGRPAPADAAGRLQGEIDRCRGVVLANKAERLFMGAPEARRVF